MKNAKITAVVLIAAMLTGCGKEKADNSNIPAAATDSSVSSVTDLTDGNAAVTADGSETAAANTEGAVNSAYAVSQAASTDNGFTVSFSSNKKYDTYSCDNGTYFYTFNSEIPQIQYSNQKYS